MGKNFILIYGLIYLLLMSQAMLGFPKMTVAETVAKGCLTPDLIVELWSKIPEESRVVVGNKEQLCFINKAHQQVMDRLFGAIMADRLVKLTFREEILKKLQHQDVISRLHVLRTPLALQAVLEDISFAGNFFYRIQQHKEWWQVHHLEEIERIFFSVNKSSGCPDHWNYLKQEIHTLLKEKRDALVSSEQASGDMMRAFIKNNYQE